MTTSTTQKARVRVLTVEDDPLLLDLLAHKITMRGWEVFTATTGDAGFKIAEEKRPDIILLDILLPGTSGHDLLKKLKASPDLSNIPVLVLSNYGEDDDIQKSLSLGAVKHLIKAYISPSEIMEKISTILQIP